MIIFAEFSIALFIAVLCGYALPKKSIIYDSFDVHHTTILKGISILLIVWGHVGKRLGIGGIQWIAGIGVTIFLICSGYGIEKSFKRKGLKDFWKKRLKGVILPFYITSFIGLVLTSWFNVTALELVRILSFQTQWFVAYILICYLLFYISAKSMSDDKSRKIFLLVCFIAWFIIDAIFFAPASAPFLRGRQMLAFITGVCLADSFTEVQSFKNKFSIIPLCVLGLSMMYVTNLDAVKNLPIIVSNFLSLFTVEPLALALIIASMYLPLVFTNRILYCAGIISYELFLVHNYSIILVQEHNFKLFLFIIGTLVLAYAVYRLDKVLKR